jgi:hypothetical protein
MNMTNRCQVGDLAVIVRDPDNNGRDAGVIVEIVGYGLDCQSWFCRSRGRRLRFFRLGGLIPWWSHEGHIPDEWLRPLRDGEGTDETMAWLVERAFKTNEAAA